MPQDTSKQGEYLVSQWLRTFYPKVTDQLRDRLTKGFGQVKIRDPLNLNYPIPLPQSRVPDVSTPSPGSIVLTVDPTDTFDGPHTQPPTGGSSSDSDSGSTEGTPSGSSSGSLSSSGSSSGDESSTADSSGGSGGSGSSDTDLNTSTQNPDLKCGPGSVCGNYIFARCLNDDNVCPPFSSGGSPLCDSGRDVACDYCADGNWNNCCGVLGGCVGTPSCPICEFDCGPWIIYCCYESGSVYAFPQCCQCCSGPDPILVPCGAP